MRKIFIMLQCVCCVIIIDCTGGGDAYIGWFMKYIINMPIVKVTGYKLDVTLDYTLIIIISRTTKL